MQLFELCTGNSAGALRPGHAGAMPYLLSQHAPFEPLAYSVAGQALRRINFPDLTHAQTKVARQPSRPDSRYREEECSGQRSGAGKDGWGRT